MTCLPESSLERQSRKVCPIEDIVSFTPHSLAAVNTDSLIFSSSSLPLPSDIDISFLIVAADLWSADGTEEMNLVQHPASHYLKASSPAPADLYKYHTGHDNRSTYSSHGLPSHVRPDSRGLATNDTSDVSRTESDVCKEVVDVSCG